ncbi:hypothetical protein PHABIO_51 [Pseudomonas phage Phabio]|uniref:Uncharacterized protein n=1 Tax=Pseudomonas phage Phabio TaxID=2006668 RepID=A0A1Y0ST87_9CAUD|nr:hypothetical protein MZD05_gp051 [Pseudomonas phage Phabio]ARV76682.1 hypothetical protein PHABIO_51 [Pseudomonas phage Phabio]
MHRKEKLNELVKQWLELGETETCSRADSFTRISILRKNNPNELHFRNSRLGTTRLIIGVVNGELGYTSGYEESREHVIIGEAIWALEYALENY